MKRLIVFGLITAGYSILVSCSPKKEKQPEVQTQEAPTEVNELPPIVLIEENGARFSVSGLSGNLVLIFFGADCDHCQREATEIYKNIGGFEHYTLYFVSLDPFPMITRFAKDYKLNTQSNIHFVRAEGSTVFKALGSFPTPTILIYSANKKLVKRFDGETKVEEILKLL
jgi:cytochrome oxidase Cu insertion factor (SCO1/SenC/PrrC family)